MFILFLNKNYSQWEDWLFLAQNQEVMLKIYVIILCLCAFLILINFNKLTIILALCSMPFAFLYPLMKRITYWPQLFLGITFNYGLLLGWTSIKEEVDLAPILFYLGAIFWTLGYDTIYGYQDIKDDEVIGLKSTYVQSFNDYGVKIEYSVGVKNLTNDFQQEFDSFKNRDSNFIYGPSLPRTIYFGVSFISLWSHYI